jgi:hypothetical protein
MVRKEPQERWAPRGHKALPALRVPLVFLDCKAPPGETAHKDYRDIQAFKVTREVLAFQVRRALPV